jgi:CSLREA domain-containing protein
VDRNTAQDFFHLEGAACLDGISLKRPENTMNPRPLLKTLCVAAVMGATAHVASASTFTVTRFDDPIPNGCAAADCSLREAVIEANATAVADTIVLGTGTYELFQSTVTSDDSLSFDLDIDQDLSIIGQGPQLTVIRNATGVANTHSRVFEIRDAQVSLSGMTVRDGSLHSPHLPIWGGALVGGCLRAWQAALALTAVTMSNCRMDAPGGRGAALFLNGTSADLIDVQLQENDNVLGSGGAMGVIDSSIAFTRVLISGNSALYGGGILAYGEVHMSGDDVQLTANTARAGGGIYFGISSPLVSNSLAWSTGSTISGNTAEEDGGAIYVAPGAVVEIAPVADASVDRDDLLSIEDNHAGGNGGGVAVDEPAGTSEPGQLDARRVALRGNSAGGDGGAAHSIGQLVIADSEIASNSAAADGGGVWIGGEALGNLIDRTSFAGNVAGSDGGAATIAADEVKLRNVSSYANVANGYGGGVLVAPRSSVALVHVTSLADSAASGGGSLAIGMQASAELRNSVLAAGCFKGAAGVPSSGLLSDSGGNAQQKGQPACAGTLATASKLALSYAYFGGRFDVVGIGSASILRESAPLLLEARLDVRRWLRRGNADAGAHEYDATQ